MARHKLITVLLTTVILLGSLVGCGQTPQQTTTPNPTPMATAKAANINSIDGLIDGYVALAPRVLRAGQTENISVSLFTGQQPANGLVRLILAKNGQTVATAEGTVQGKTEVAMSIPQVAEGDYQLQLKGQSFETSSAVRVEEGTILFVETDKPIYKPGQTVHIRVLTLDPQLKPVSGATTIEVSDAKGSKVFKQDVNTDDYGMTAIDMPLSTEPNLGVWKIVAKAGKKTAQIDVRIERYVLPKYEVKVDLPKEWVLAGEKIKGTVSAEYSYGKPVQGELQIRALRYVGSWQEFANITRELDGKLDFDLPGVQYTSGVPNAGGQGNVQLEVTVREKSTGYEEKTTQLLTVSATPVTLRVIPESVIFKPELPLSLLVVAETPDKKPSDASVKLNVTYTKSDFKTSNEAVTVAVKNGKAITNIMPPKDAISLTLTAASGKAYTSMAMQSGYSPSGTFIAVEQTNQDTVKVGDTARFKVSSTKVAKNFYYEVLSRGTVVFSDYSQSPDISFTVTPQMVPSARLLVYQILPTSEVAADYLPFTVDGTYPQKVEVGFSQGEVKPGDQVNVNVTTEGAAKVALAAVDRSVFILAENRLNLQQVFAELEKLYQQPQVELHSVNQSAKILSRGAKETFNDAGVVVMSNKQVPAGKEYTNSRGGIEANGMGAPFAGAQKDAAAPAAAMPMAAPAATSAPAAQSASEDKSSGLAEVQRIRQFFPETWIWADLLTDAAGKATKQFTAPDSITTWMLRAVALSKNSGLGISEAKLIVMQPFFVQIDLPYAVIRGEQFPVKVALYNYQGNAEDFMIDIEQSDWFQLLDQSSKTINVGANSLGGASFTIRPSKLGTNKVKITARSKTTADAIVKELIVEPEGVAREEVENAIIAAGNSRQLATALPDGIIEGSGRTYISITGNYLTQTLEGLEGLLKMPFGCGEQNMILFAPNVFVSRYLKETGQMKAEVMAKAENLMITGYQRELTYRRSDGSFSAFGEQDKSGSLWLTAFVLKTFAQAKSVIFVDDNVLNTAKAWIVKQQKADGSFEPVGFVHHEELLGGLKGKEALTAYLAVALKEAGDEAGSAKAIKYLEGKLDSIDDSYGLALTAYALTLAKSPKAAAAHDKLMAKAQEDEAGLHWGEAEVVPVQKPGVAPMEGDFVGRQRTPSAAIETTAYATLALTEQGDRLNAGRAAKWLVSQRNAYGGFGSTQDTVVGLQALTNYAANAKSDVDATVTLRTGDWQKEVRVSPENVDVLQVIDVPMSDAVQVEAKGKGQVVLQAVRRYNVPEPQVKAQSAFQIDVAYGADQIEVNDLIDVNVRIKYTPPEEVQAGMVVLDVAVPTGFTADSDSITAMVKGQPKIKRYDVAGRKVIIYIEDMNPDEQLQFSFKARALYPVKAQAVTSQAYSYYRPDWKGESMGGKLTVAEAN